jgi:hypothetical protein
MRAVLLLALGAILAEGGELRLVDMVVAQVDTSVVTYSELLAETRLVVLRTRGPELARSGAFDEQLLKAVLRSIVSRELLLREARRLQLREVSQAEVEAAIAEIQGRFQTAGDYQRFLERIGLAPQSGDGRTGPPPALVAIVRAELQVARFINLRVRPGVAVRESDLQRCYEANRHLLGGEELAAVRPLIERALREERSDSAIDTLVTQLEKKATLRFAPGFDPPPAGASRPRKDDRALELRCPEALGSEAP